mmetsp:Transcript_41723/g.105185  ORF Transcript_41723/g.105185 Transcript_41723/m.105185 type:complete len:332 (-) Transcript_41723:1979-2974(-)
MCGGGRSRGCGGLQLDVGGRKVARSTIAGALPPVSSIGVLRDRDQVTGLERQLGTGLRCKVVECYRRKTTRRGGTRGRRMRRRGGSGSRLGGRRFGGTGLDLLDVGAREEALLATETAQPPAGVVTLDHNENGAGGDVQLVGVLGLVVVHDLGTELARCQWNLLVGHALPHHALTFVHVMCGQLVRIAIVMLQQMQHSVGVAGNLGIRETSLAERLLPLGWEALELASRLVVGDLPFVLEVCRGADRHRLPILLALLLASPKEKCHLDGIVVCICVSVCAEQRRLAGWRTERFRRDRGDLRREPRYERETERERERDGQERVQERKRNKAK